MSLVLYSTFKFNPFLCSILLFVDPPVLQDSEGLAVVNETQTINMSCTFFSLPSPDITWSRSIPSMEIMDNEKYTIYTMNIPSDGGVLSLSTLEIMNVVGLDTGSYTCLASNFAHGPSAPVDTSSNTFTVIVQSTYTIFGYIRGWTDGYMFAATH